MQNKSKTWVRRVGWVLPWAAIGLAGCSSYRIATSLQPSGQPVPAAESVRFRLSEVRYATATNVTASGLSPFSTYTYSGASLREDLMAAAVAVYPKVFSADASALPLEVSIQCVTNTTAMGELAACASCVTLTVVPIRHSEQDLFRVETTSGIPAVDARLARPVTFERTDVGWLSLLPTGWIPVPAPGGEPARGTDRALVRAKDATLKACVEAIVIGLRRIDPAEWPAPKNDSP